MVCTGRFNNYRNYVYDKYAAQSVRLEKNYDLYNDLVLIKQLYRVLLT